MDKNEEWFRKMRNRKFLVGEKIVCIEDDRPCHKGDKAVVTVMPKEVAFGEWAADDVRFKALYDEREYYMIQTNWRLV